MSRLRKAAKATVVAHAFNWIGLLLSLVTVPLYLHWLGQERYGLLLTGLAFAGYLMFSDAGLNWASMLLIAQANGREDRATIASIVRNSYSLAACSAGLVALTVAAAWFLMTHSSLLRWLPQHVEFPGLLVAVGASVVCNLGISPVYNLLTGLQEAHLSALYQGIGRISGTLAAVGIAWAGAPLAWVFAGNVAGALIAGVSAGVHCRRRHAWAFQSGSRWEWPQIRQQLRTGAKSITMQVGNVLWGTAPVLAISTAAGAQYVPYFSIPMTLMNAPLGFVNSFSASLQPGYGEAMARGETQWVAATVQRILRQVLFIVGLLGCGFLLLAGPFVHLWTGGKIELSHEMLANVFGIAAVGAVMTALRYALTGINRHRRAALGDLVCGGLAMTLGIIVVSRYGYQWVGAAVVGAVILTSGWILPRELHHALGKLPIVPRPDFLLRWSALVVATSAAGWLIVLGTASLPSWLTITVAGVGMTGAFLLLGLVLLREEVKHLERFIPSQLRTVAHFH